MARSARISQLGLIDGRNGTFGISRLESTSDLPDDTHGAWPAATKATDSAPQEQFRPTAVITSAVTAGGMATLQANMEEPAERVLPGRCRGPVMAGLVNVRLRLNSDRTLGSTAAGAEATAMPLTPRSARHRFPWYGP